MEEGVCDALFHARIVVAALADAITHLKGVQVEDAVEGILAAACLFDKEYGADGAERGSASYG